MDESIMKDEELMSLKLDRPGRVKSEEQLAKHTLEAQLDNKPIERSVFLLTKGDDVQKLSIVQNLLQLYNFEPNATVNRIIPKIQQELASSSSEFNIAAAKTFLDLIQNNVPVNFLNSILLGTESKDPLVASIWIETLLEAVSYLPETQIKNDILKWVQMKSEGSRPTMYKVACCHLLGRCAIHPKIQSVEVKTMILPIVQSLAQDGSYEVRACMAGQLANVAQGLANPEIIQFSLLPNVVELARDTNVVVRSAAIVAIAQLLPEFSPETKSDVVVPLLKDICHGPSSFDHDSIYPVLSKEFGKYMLGLQSVLSNSDCIQFIQFYKSLSTKGIGTQGDTTDPTQGVYCRHFCALNLPSITQFTLNKATTAMDTWYSTFKELAADPCYIVRKAVAGCLHEVVGILASQCKIVKPDIVRLLRDDAEDVLFMIVPKLGTTMELLAIYGLLSKEQSTQISLEIGRAILKCHMEILKGTNWRMQTEMLKQLEHLPNCLTSDFIHQHFTPIIFQTISDHKARPVKSQAAILILVFLRYNIKELQRKWIRENLMNRLYSSNSCYTRIIFVKMCEGALTVFSKKYFKEYFFQPLLSFLEDKISNVRYCTIGLLPQMKAMLAPEDKSLTQMFDTTVKKLYTDEIDKDVLNALKCAMKTMEKIRYVMPPDERARQDEETKIAQGKVVENSRLIEALPVEIKRLADNQASAIKPTVKPIQTPTSSQSKFSILERHFYIDAGVELAKTIKEIPTAASQSSTSSSSMKQNDIFIFNFDSLKLNSKDETVESLSMNFTDDVKLNMKMNGPKNSQIETGKIAIRKSKIPIIVRNKNAVSNRRPKSQVFYRNSFCENQKIMKNTRRYSLELSQN